MTLEPAANPLKTFDAAIKPPAPAQIVAFFRKQHILCLNSHEFELNVQLLRLFRRCQVILLAVDDEGRGFRFWYVGERRTFQQACVLVPRGQVESCMPGDIKRPGRRSNRAYYSPSVA